MVEDNDTYTKSSSIRKKMKLNSTTLLNKIDKSTLNNNYKNINSIKNEEMYMSPKQDPNSFNNLKKFNSQSVNKNKIYESRIKNFNEQVNTVSMGVKKEYANNTNSVDYKDNHEYELSSASANKYYNNSNSNKLMFEGKTTNNTITNVSKFNINNSNSKHINSGSDTNHLVNKYISKRNSVIRTNTTNTTNNTTNNTNINDTLFNANNNSNNSNIEYEKNNFKGVNSFNLSNSVNKKLINTNIESNKKQKTDKGLIFPDINVKLKI